MQPGDIELWRKILPVFARVMTDVPGKGLNVGLHNNVFFMYSVWPVCVLSPLSSLWNTTVQFLLPFSA